MQEVSWRKFYSNRRSFTWDMFVFVPEEFDYEPDATCLIAYEDEVYEDDDDETPEKLAERGFKYLAQMNEISMCYDDVWVHKKGKDSFFNFCKCVDYYLTRDGLLFP